MVEQQKRVLRSKSSRQDDSIMGTNSSSITSKRSVERLYFPNEPHFFRHFVNKPQRRAPLINRGYWLRIKAIDFVVRQFLEEAGGKTKIIVNLGCGYDPLPWQCLTKYPELCKCVKFIDVDYEDLMIKKRDVVNRTDELRGMLTNLSSGESPLLLSSDQYFQIACDLRDLTRLNTALSSVFNREECLVMFSAEVSLTYMLSGADSLIKWAGSFPHVRFALLEQILPGGEEHPFASKMLEHFQKLQTPLGSVHKYPTTADQEYRFSTAGWANVRAVNLWELWASSDLGFLTPSQRISLDQIEAFDEWEEFALFACHYFLLLAENGTPSGSSIFELQRNSRQSIPSSEVKPVSLNFTESQKHRGCRRFAASMPLRGLKRQQDLIGSFAGMGLSSRLDTSDAYTLSVDLPDVPDQLYHQNTPFPRPSNRMCHTITDMGDLGSLLIGGRASPDRALADCWLYHKWTNSWEQVDDLPVPRYRHGANFLGNGKVMIIGGKTNSANVVNDILTWDRRNGWMVVREERLGNFPQSYPPLRFGAILCVTSPAQNNSSTTVSGLLAGGMSQDGVVLRDVWLWTLNERKEMPFISFESIASSHAHRFTESLTTSLARFGASIIDHHGSLVVVGGVGPSSLLSDTGEFIYLDIPSSGIDVGTISARPLQTQISGPRPLLIGVSVSSNGNNLVITGGGAVCFSFGTHWNKGCYTLAFDSPSESSNKTSLPTFRTWEYVETVNTETIRIPLSPTSELSLSASSEVQVVRIKRLKLTSRQDFDAILSAARPVILEGLNLGKCTKTWNSDYLKERVGLTKQVVVHKAAQEQMNFVSKNFEYVPMQFGDFIDAIDAGQKLYLRSLSANKPSELPADLSTDFPAIAADFSIPNELDLVKETAHSSPLRISGPVKMWLHYDVMANILCQITGSKRLLLFPPGDIQYLDFAPGASSSTLNVFEKLNESKLGRTNPHEAMLEPGEVLFIPPMYLHAASPIQDVSVAVNVFFKSLPRGYAPGRDIYGNRDLQAYEKGRQDVAKISRSFDGFPPEIRQFYKVRLAEEMRQSAEK